MKKRILSILLTLCMVLCLVPTAAFAEDNEDAPTQALTNVDITFPKPEEGKKIGNGSEASANADSGLNLYLFGPALWQQDGKPKKLNADDTYEKDNIYLLNFTFYTQKPITDETVLTFNGNPITRYPDYPTFEKAASDYDGTQDAYLGFVMFSAEGTGDPSMKDLKDLYIVGLYAIIRAQEAQTPEDTVKEQFTLTSGDTYYFDLSARASPARQTILCRTKQCIMSPLPTPAQSTPTSLHRKWHPTRSMHRRTNMPTACLLRTTM